MRKIYVGLVLALASSLVLATTIDLNSDATRSVKNDTVRATVVVEFTGTSSPEVVRKVSGGVEQVLSLSRQYKGVTVQTGSVQTYPNYSNKQRIEGWRMRSEVLLESQDSASVSELLGKLQANPNVVVADVTSDVSIFEQRRVESDLIVEAIEAFREKSALIAKALGKPYSIKKLTINRQGGPIHPVRPMMRGMVAMAAEAAPMPIEGGNSQISVMVSGQIEVSE